MARRQTEIHPPLAGLDRAWAYQSQAPFTFADGSNVRCRDVFERRARLGSRPGLTRILGTHIGGEVEVTEFLVYSDIVQINESLPDFQWSPVAVNGANVGGEPSEFYRTLLRFDISSIDADTVNEAILFLHFDKDQLTHNRTYAVRRLTQTGWVEDQVTWNDYATGTPWSVAGGDATTTNAASFSVTTAEADDADPNIGGQYRSVDVTEILNDAIAAGKTTLDLLILDSDEAGLPVGGIGIQPYYRGASFVAEQHTLSVSFQRQEPRALVVPSQDTYIDKIFQDPDASLATFPYFSVSGRTAGFPVGIQHGLLHFDCSAVSPLPASAVLRLVDLGEGVGYFDNHASVDLLIQRVTLATWIDTLVGWLVANEDDDWTTEGGDVTTALQVAHNYSTVLNPDNTVYESVVIEIDVLDLVLDAINEREGQLHLRISTSTVDAFGYASKDWPDQSLWPTLILEF